jgi:hypothetical protein
MDWCIAESLLKCPKHCHVNLRGNIKAAVIIETRRAYFIGPLINTTMRVLGCDWNLYVFCGEYNEQFLREQLQGWNVNILKLPIVDLNQANYNYLLSRKAFWMNFKEEYMLFFDINSYIMRPPPDFVWDHTLVVSDVTNFKLFTVLKSKIIRVIEDTKQTSVQAIYQALHQAPTKTFSYQIFNDRRDKQALCGVYAGTSGL